VPRNHWDIPSRFPAAPPVRTYRGMTYAPLGVHHASAVSRAISTSRFAPASGWEVKVDQGRIVVRCADHLTDRIDSALSASRYSYYSFGNGTDVYFYHVRGKYTPMRKSR